MGYVSIERVRAGVYFKDKNRDGRSELNWHERGESTGAAVICLHRKPTTNSGERINTAYDENYYVRPIVIIIKVRG